METFGNSGREQRTLGCNIRKNILKQIKYNIICGARSYLQRYIVHNLVQKKTKKTHRNKESKQRLEIQPGVTNILKS